MTPDIRFGHGYDVHAFAAERELWLCGVKIEYPVGLLGHSDADVAIHALCDALLGAAALRDIGYHFPDNDNSFKGIDSKILLRKTCELLSENGWEIGNTDITIIAQAPKLSPQIPQMIEVLSEIMNLPSNRVSVKATTTEHLGFTGRKEGIAAIATALISKK